MTGYQLLNAAPILQKIIEFELPVKKAYQIYTLIKAIEDKREFFMSEERKLIAKFNAEITENGDIKFNSMEDHSGFSIAHSGLLSYEIEDVNSIELNFDSLKGANLSPRDIMQLENVIIFID